MGKSGKKKPNQSSSLTSTSGPKKRQILEFPAPQSQSLANSSDHPTSQPPTKHLNRHHQPPVTTPIQSNTQPFTAQEQHLPLLAPHPRFSDVPKEVDATNRSNLDVTSAITNIDTVEETVLLNFTKYYVFPKLKFALKVSEDPRWQWSTHPKSLCQYILSGCNVKFDSRTSRKQKQQQWYSMRKTVADKIVSLRNDKSSAIRHAFYGKFICFFNLQTFFSYVFCRLFRRNTGNGNTTHKT